MGSTTYWKTRKIGQVPVVVLTGTKMHDILPEKTMVSHLAGLFKAKRRFGRLEG